MAEEWLLTAIAEEESKFDPELPHENTSYFEDTNPYKGIWDTKRYREPLND